MTVAFSVAGATIGILAFQTWKAARAAKFSTTLVDWNAHRNWGIRSYSQILAPMLYRYWYFALHLFHLYSAPNALSSGGVCNDDDICPEYLRIVDKLHCWTYWMTSLLVAEIIIYYLPSNKEAAAAAARVTSSQVPANVDREEGKTSAPLLEGHKEGGGTKSLPYGSDQETPPLLGVVQTSSSNNDAAVSNGENESSTSSDDKSSALVVNAIGVSLAVVAATITTLFFS
jgi:hypothetical protein